MLSRTVLLFTLFVAPLWAGPEGGTVVDGQAAIRTAGGVTQIQQSTDRAIINWQRFNTSPTESVNFAQPSATSVTLNRVVSVDPSVLGGSLSANGRLFLINPNGIVFGPTSQVNVGSLVASTLDLSDADFKAGRYTMVASPGKPLAAVVNQGSITAAKGGTVALVAPVVDNQGKIVAVAGRVMLAAAARARLDLDAGMISLDVPTQRPRDVVVGTDGSYNPLEAAVNNKALVCAGAVVRKDGKVILGGAEGLVVQAGEVRTDGASGGAVLIDSTRATQLAAGSVTSANATAAGGTGGSVRVLSQGTTSFERNALVEARGGTGGAGGFVEVSGKNVRVAGQVTTEAVHGRTGTFLIDPDTLKIVDTGMTADLDACLAGGTLTAGQCMGNNSITVQGVLDASTANNVLIQARSVICLANSAGNPITTHTGKALTIETVPNCGANKSLIKASGTGGISAGGDLIINANNGGTCGVIDLSNIQVSSPGTITMHSTGVSANTGIVVGRMCAKTINLQASGGTIKDGHAGHDLTACDIILGAPGGIGSGADSIEVKATKSLTLTGCALHVVNTCVADSLVVTSLNPATNTIAIGQDTTLLANAAGSVTLDRGGHAAVNVSYNNCSSFQIGVFDAGTGTVLLHSANGAITGVTGAGLVTAGDLTVSTASGVGTGCVGLQTVAGKFSAGVSGSTGGVHVCNAGSVRLGSIIATGNVVVSASLGGDITVDTIRSNSTVSLAATGGRIVQGSGAPGGSCGIRARCGGPAPAVNFSALTGIGTPCAAMKLVVGQASGSTGTSGIHLAPVGSTRLASLTAPLGNISVDASSGNMTLSSLSAPSGTISVVAHSGSIFAEPVGTNITAQAAELTAVCGRVGTSCAPVQTVVDTLTASGTTGNFVTNSKTLAALSVTSGADLTLLLTSGDLNVGRIAAGGTMDLEVPLGRILRAGGGTNLDGGAGTTAKLVATGGIGADGAALTAKVGRLDASTIAGGVFVQETDGLSFLRAIAPAGDVAIGTTAGSLVVKLISAGGAAKLSAPLGSITQDPGGSEVLARSLALVAGAGGVGRSGAPLLTRVDTLTASAAGDVRVENETAFTAHAVNGANVSLKADAGNLTVDMVSATASIDLRAPAGSLVKGVGANSLQGGSGVSARLTAATGIGSTAAPLEVAVGSLDAHANAGAIAITADDDLTLGSIEAPGGNVLITSTHCCLTVQSIVASGDVALKAPQGAILSGGPGTNITAHDLDLFVCSYAGTRGQPLSVALSGKLDAVGFSVWIDAVGPLNVDRVVTMFDDRISSSGDMQLRLVEADLGAVALASTGGSIVDANGDAVNVIANSFTSSRFAAAGTIGLNDAIEVAVAYGDLEVAPGAAVGGVSAMIAGSVLPAQGVLATGAPGQVFFNGRIGMAEEDDPATVQRTDPTQSVAGSLNGAPNTGNTGGAGLGTVQLSDLIDISALGAP